jgi:hypothetical protein
MILRLLSELETARMDGDSIKVTDIQRTIMRLLDGKGD